MAVVKLTARNIATLPGQSDRRVDYVDAILPGFTLRVSPRGSRTFAVRYFRNGKVQRYTIGPTPPLSLAAARDLARRVLADVTKGADPQGEKVAARRKRTQGLMTLGSLCERFLSEGKNKDNLPLRPSTLYNWHNIVKAEIEPAFGSRRPEEITRREVRTFVETIAEHRPYWANRVFELLRRVFSWAVENELLAASPCVGLKKPGGENPRDRVLSSDEIRSIWGALDGGGLFADAVRLLFLTAARPREVLNARWAEVDLEDRFWRIPSARMKNREPHVMPLSAGTMAVLERLRKAAASDEWLFPSPVGAGPLVAIAKQVQRIRKQAGVSFQLRDVRRTVRTRLREMGVSQDVSEAILSHAPPRIIRTYDRYEPVPEMRTALEAWSARLERIVSDEVRKAVVVPLARV
jgi:integrase